MVGVVSVVSVAGVPDVFDVLPKVHTFTVAMASFLQTYQTGVGVAEQPCRRRKVHGRADFKRDMRQASFQHNIVILQAAWSESFEGQSRFDGDCRSGGGGSCGGCGGWTDSSLFVARARWP